MGGLSKFTGALASAGGVVGGGGGGPSPPPGDATVWPDVATDADLRASGLRTGDRQRTTTPAAEWVYSGTAWEIETLTAATIADADAVLAASPAIAGARIAITGAEVCYRATAALSLPGGGTRQITVPAEVYDWGSLTVRAYLGGAEDGTARTAQGWTAGGGGTITGDEGGTGTTLLSATGSGAFASLQTAASAVTSTTRAYLRWGDGRAAAGSGTGTLGTLVADGTNAGFARQIGTTTAMQCIYFPGGSPVTLQAGSLRAGGVLLTDAAEWEVIDRGRDIGYALRRNRGHYHDARRDQGNSATNGLWLIATAGTGGTSTLRLRDVWIITA
jgi:hypothetical protein